MPTLEPSTAVQRASGCFKNCSDEIWDTIGDPNAFCALSVEQRSCMSDEGIGMGGCAHAEALIQAHCACGSFSRDILFNGTSSAVDVTGKSFCFGNATCRESVVDLVQALVGSEAVGGTGAWTDRNALYSELVLPCVPEAYTYQSIPNVALDWSCLETCPGNILAVVGDQDAFCTLDAASKACLHTCMPRELLEMHCACKTGLLFSSSETADGSLTADVGILSQVPKELDFNGTLFCYGPDMNLPRPLPSSSEACRTAVVDVMVLADYNISSEVNANIYDVYYSDLDRRCNCLMTCPDEVQVKLGEEDLFCSLPDEELACMLNTEISPLLRAVHCKCHSGLLFADKEWGDFDALGQAYCCAKFPTLFELGGGGDACQAAVLALALGLDDSNLSSAEMTQLLDSQCDDVDDDTGDLRLICTTAAPTPSPTLTLAPTITPCTLTCTDELKDTMGDFDDFCALGNFTAYSYSYCLSDYLISDVQLEVHCVCDSRKLFLIDTDDFDVLMGEPYCCGSDTCQASILDLAVELDIGEYGDPRDTRINNVNPNIVNVTLVAQAILREWREEDAYIAGLFETASYVAQLNYSDPNCTETTVRVNVAAEDEAKNGTDSQSINGTFINGTFINGTVFNGTNTTYVYSAANATHTTEVRKCSFKNESQVYRFSTDYGEYTYLENVTYEYTYADYWGLKDREHSPENAYDTAMELVAQIYADAVADHRATVQAGLESSCRDPETGSSIYECRTPFPTHSPTAAPSTADTATVSIGVKMIADEPPTPKQKVTLKSVIAAKAGVPVSAIKNFQITTIENTKRRNLLSVTWDVTFDMTTSLSNTGDGDLSTSSELGTVVTDVLSSDDFTAAVADADQSLELTVDSTSITAIASTRRPSQVPTRSPTVTPTVTLYPTPLPTQCEDVAEFCTFVTSYCSVSFCRTCPNNGLCDETCEVCSIRVPTVQPTLSLVPSPVPTPLPTPVPVLTPTPLPTVLPSPIPFPLPTSMPTPLPTSLPTLLPSEIPTPPPSPVPSPSPTPLPSAIPSPAPSEMPFPAPSGQPTPLPTQLPTLPPTPAPTSLPAPAPTPLPTYVPSSSPTINCIASSTDNNLNSGIRKRLFRVTMRSTASNGGWGNYKYELTKLATVSSSKGDSDSVQVATGTLLDGNKWEVDFLCLEVPTDNTDENAVQCYYLDIILDGAELSAHPPSSVQWGVYDEASSIYTKDSGNFPDVPSEDAFMTGEAGGFARVCAKRGSDTVIGGLFGGVPSPNPTLSLLPTQIPTPLPTQVPTPKPTQLPTLPPSPQPSVVPSPVPTPVPTIMPTPAPTQMPTPSPSLVPSIKPTQIPTFPPSPLPTPVPTMVPTSVPTMMPSPLPSLAPTPKPTPLPSLAPTSKPTPLPTPQPTVACTEGRYFDYQDNGKSVCRDCPAGRYLNQTRPKDAIPANWGWKRECRQCPLGKSQPDDAQSKCITCSEGTYSVRESEASAGPDLCRSCQAGEYAFNGTQCVECELGRYAPAALISFCIACPSGYYTGVAVKATECQDCSPGNYNAGADYYINDYRAANSYELECIICPAVNSLHCVFSN